VKICNILSRIGLLLILCVSTSGFERKTLLFEDFESTNSLSAWLLTSTRDGRIRFELSPQLGSQGLLMDDAVNDAEFSENIAARTLSIAGYSEIRFELDVYSFDDEVHNSDGVVLRAGTLTRVLRTQWLREQHFDY
jgi:hypothetical protein